MRVRTNDAGLEKAGVDEDGGADLAVNDQCIHAQRLVTALPSQFNLWGVARETYTRATRWRKSQSSLLRMGTTRKLDDAPTTGGRGHKGVSGRLNRRKKREKATYTESCRGRVCTLPELSRRLHTRYGEVASCLHKTTTPTIPRSDIWRRMRAMGVPQHTRFVARDETADVIIDVDA
jgi:hypothetical protein